MSNLVVYHNDLNKLKIPNFSASEQNLLMGILVKIKSLKNEKTIKFYPNELRNFFDRNLTDNEIGKIASALRYNFFKTDFTILIKDEERKLYGTEIINLFSGFKIYFYDEDYIDFSHIELELNDKFKYLVQEITANFTEFELIEFMEISSKYAKTLYRLLKQFRNTGFFKIQWQELCDILDIPQSYKMCSIDNKILKPATKELSKIFKDLSYTKIKDKKGRGRGGKVIGIEFHFTAKEIIEVEIKQEKQTKKKIARTKTLYFNTEQEAREYDRKEREAIAENKVKNEIIDLDEIDEKELEELMRLKKLQKKIKAKIVK